jgi:hypothetical protein
MDLNAYIGIGARMIAVALISALVTATLVIAVGQSMLSRVPPGTAEPRPAALRTPG